MRVELVHDWLTGMRGGEKVLRLLCGLFPQANLLTLVHVPGSVSPEIEARRIRTSFVNDLPGVGRYYRRLLPLLPFAAESLPAEEYDLIVSCSHCVAKGVIRRPDAAHICYCFTPMRYVWAQADAYRGRMGAGGTALWAVQKYLRAWDRRSARHVDRFLANSANVAKRIGTTYGRSADVVYSPIDTAYYTPGRDERKDFYLMVTALSPYKKVDVAVEAFRQLDKPLRIIGSGPAAASLQRIAPDHVELLGWQSDDVIREHYRTCKAVIFPGEEDFGLVPLEAMACGAPVIALGRGGALETVKDIHHHGRDATGLLYENDSAAGLAHAVRKFEAAQGEFRVGALNAWANQFSHERFLAEFKQAAEPVIRATGLTEPW